MHYEIEGCACGWNHEKMPVIETYLCDCKEFPHDEGCDHKTITIEAICRRHLRHFPCRVCAVEDEIVWALDNPTPPE